MLTSIFNKKLMLTYKLTSIFFIETDVNFLDINISFFFKSDV